jgi:hypothetical protein
MNKVKIRLIQLGYPPIALTKAVRWKSKFFEIDMGVYHRSDLPDSDGTDWSYSKKLLSKIIGNGRESDITIGVIDKPIEANYYLHRLSEKTCVLSLYEMSGILAKENIPPEMFLIRNIYEVITLYFEFGGRIKSDAYTAHHEDTRGCLFDFNAIKSDIIASTKHVGLCSECSARLSQKKLPFGFVDGLEAELKRIKKPLVFRVIDFVKEHPIWSLGISLVISVSVNVVSNYIYAFFVSKF